MSWARVDDGFDDHPKVVAILDDDDPAAATAAIALWTLCLTWAHRNTRKRGKTPGLLPAGLPRRFVGSLAKAGVELLVKNRLWDEVDDGWMIHDFADYLPTDQTREARSEAGRAGAAKRWGKGADGNLPSGSHRADSKGDGTANGKTMAKHGSRAKNGAVDARAANGVRPSTDGDEDALFGHLGPDVSAGRDSKLPSPSHDVDSKPVANDGSRALARRAISKEIAPTPVPIPEDQNSSAPSEPPQPPADGEPEALSITQRSKRITDAYAQLVPLSKWPAVNSIVIRSIKTELYTDEQIHDALMRLAEDGRAVTIDSLRIEIEGSPKSRPGAHTAFQNPAASDYDDWRPNT